MRAVLMILLGACIQISCAPHIGGQLVDPVGQPITSPEARVNVIALESGGNGTMEILTPDAGGKFESTLRVSSGTYLIEALVPGYKSQSLKVTGDDCKNLQVKLESAAKISTSTFRAYTTVSPDQGAGGVNITPPQL